jgi:transcriptional regulator with XRE-family HTH domain
MHQIDIESYIIGENFQQARELQGKSRSYISQKLCCSELQIQQIEEGGKSSFYTEAQKLKTAKKMAELLKMTSDQAFLGVSPELKSEINFAGFQRHERSVSIPKFTFSGAMGLGLICLIISGYGAYEFLSPDANLYNVALKSPNNSEIQTSQSMNINDGYKEEVIVLEKNLAQDSTNPCSIQAQNTNTFVPSKANFAGNFVVLTSKTPQSVCVIDGNGNQQKIDIIPGQNKVVNGVGPFRLLSHHLYEIDAYYQGMKVVNLTQNAQSIELKEAPVQLRAEPVKTIVVSQARENNESSEAFSNTGLPSTRLNATSDNGSGMPILDNKVNSASEE